MSRASRVALCDRLNERARAFLPFCSRSATAIYVFTESMHASRFCPSARLHKIPPTTNNDARARASHLGWCPSLGDAHAHKQAYVHVKCSQTAVVRVGWQRLLEMVIDGRDKAAMGCEQVLLVSIECTLTRRVSVYCTIYQVCNLKNGRFLNEGSSVPLLFLFNWNKSSAEAHRILVKV